jgi:L-aminopeptidase/D-esterase-like protein
MTVGGEVTVTAITVVNALGDVLDEQGGILAGARRAGGFVNSQRLLTQMAAAPAFNAMESTTLSVVITDAKLDKLQCGIVARMSHDGFARAICPVHTPVDGDCIFVMATGKKRSNVFQIGAAASEVVAMSIRRAVRIAEGREGVPSVVDLQASTLSGN